MQKLSENHTETALNKKVTLTRFPNRQALKRKTSAYSMHELIDIIKNTKANTKDGLPLFKLATFGNKKTEKGCLRNDGNVLSVTGIEADYDEGTISIYDAAKTLEKFGVAAIIYTTPTGTDENPRWRVFCPLSSPVSPDQRTKYVMSLNGIFKGKIDQVSFNLSQSYYAGYVTNSREMKILAVDGNFIDTITKLPKLHRGHGYTGNSLKDDSGSSELMRLATRMKAQGESFDQFCKDVQVNVKAASHLNRQSNPERALERAWQRSQNGPTMDDISTMLMKISSEDFEETQYEAGFDDNSVINKLVREHKNKFRFDHKQGYWYVFDGNIWRRDDSKCILDSVRKISINVADLDEKKGKGLRQVSRWEAIERGARSDQHFIAPDWDQDDFRLGTPQGTIDLKTGILQKGKPAHGITKSTSVAPIPLDKFDEELDCPVWLDFLNEAFNGDSEAILFFQRWCGYILTGDSSEQALLFVYGPGGSGKSTAINTIADIVGDYAIGVATSTLTVQKNENHPEEIARLDGARFAHANETESGVAWAENKLKSLTGQDKITARYMRQNSFTFFPKFKFIIVGNNQPRLNNIDGAIKRRFQILPFNQIPKICDPKLSNKLTSEHEAILSWMLLGCLDWQEQGLSIPLIVKQATEEYFDEQDLFAQWIYECCILDASGVETASDLWESWNNFAFRMGENTLSKTRTFPEKLKQYGLRSIRDTNGIRGRGFKGLKLGCHETDAQPSY